MAPDPGVTERLVERTEAADRELLDFLRFLPDGASIVRRSHLDEVYEAIPRDPRVRIAVSTVQMAPRSYNAYHVHNGTAVYMIVQGELEIEFPEQTKHYRVGDAYIEPIGVVHRAFNPDEVNPMTAVGFLVTAADREHITVVAGPDPDGSPSMVPAEDARK